MFLSGNLRHLTIIVRKTHLNYRSVGRLSMQKIRTFVNFAELYLIIFTSVGLKTNFSMFVNIPQYYLAYKRHTIKTCLKILEPLSHLVCFCLRVRKREINRACAFHSLGRFFKIQTLLTN